MSRQMGSHITALLKTEATYGTAPSGNWEQVPIIDFDPGAGSDLAPDSRQLTTIQLALWQPLPNDQRPEIA